MKVLLLSAYDTPSHRYWCQSLQRHLKNIDWTYLSLPGRYFSWRIRSNALTWSVKQADLLAAHYDFVLATSMTDLATLRGLCPALSSVPNILYFHENQFAYPVSESAHASVEPQMVTIYSALCADRVVFNSDYNRQTFLSGVDCLLRQFPDEVPLGILPLLTAKSSVLPVPVEQNNFGDFELRQNKLPLEIVWNHRWEYDKGPDALLAYVNLLPPELQLKFHIVGQQFRKQPDAFEKLKLLLIERGWLGEWGYLENRQSYNLLLHKSHAVLSTALHDFQGLAVLEAVAAGCLPLVPRRLVYPEWFGDLACYAENEQEGESLSAKIAHLHSALVNGVLPEPIKLTGLTWPALLSKYEALFS